MIRRISILLAVLFCICTTSRANTEYDITFEKGNKYWKIDLPYGIISFRLVEYSDYHQVLVSFESTEESEAILIFKNSKDDKSLKKNKPKIEFIKTYPGSKGNRKVYGCKELSRPFIPIIPQENKSDLFSFNVSNNAITKLVLPLYRAGYKKKQLSDKGPYNTDYKIISEDILDFNIEVIGWSEDDPDYVSAKSDVEDYIRIVNEVTFCDNSKHDPSLSEQQKPYKERRDSLISIITTRLQNPNWLHNDAPHIAYSKLLTDLNNVNLDAHNQDCGGHKPKPIIHTCSYCSLNAQEVYHQLDDLYQQLRAGKVSKDDAARKAKALNNCYRSSTKRKKESLYTEKISTYYNRIVNY